MPREVSPLCAAFRDHLRAQGFARLDDLYPKRPDRQKITDYFREQPALIIEEKDFDQAEVAALQKLIHALMAMKSRYHPTSKFISELRPQMWTQHDREAFLRIEKAAGSKVDSIFTRANRQLRATYRVLQKQVDSVLLITNEYAGDFPMNAAHWPLNRKLLKRTAHGYRFDAVLGYLYLQSCKDMPYAADQDYYEVMVRKSESHLQGVLVQLLKTWPDNRVNGNGDHVQVADF